VGEVLSNCGLFSPQLFYVATLVNMRLSVNVCSDNFPMLDDKRYLKA